MNNVFVYCELEGTQVAEVSQELLTKGRKLADELGVQLHAIVAGTGIKGKVEEQIFPYGTDKIFVFDAEGLFPYTSAPHTDILVNLFKEEQPQICLMGATVIGRDLGPRVSSALFSGLTADCTELEIGDFDMTVGKDADGNDLPFLYNWDGSGSQGDDIYFVASVNGVSQTFVVESYLRGKDTDLYKAVEALKVGDKIDIEAFIYWYEGAQPHVVGVTASK